MLELIAADPRAWEDEFVRVRDLRTLGMRSDLAREVRAGGLVPVCRGIYRRAKFVSAHDDDDRYLALLRGSQLTTDRPLTFALLSAACVWRLPMIGRWPRTVHVVDDWKGGGRSTAGIVRHGWGAPEVPVERDGLLVTSLVRTVVDVARTAPFAVGVAAADSALRGIRGPNGWFRAPLPREAFDEAVAAVGGMRGCVRAREVLAFADARSESAGESLSRVAIRRLGFPAAVLQQEFRDRNGRMIVDFWWPECNVIGEFDGHGKYLRSELTGGRSAAEIVIAEKHREDRLRALGPTVTRWDWDVASSLPLLRDRLYRAGVRVH